MSVEDVINCRKKSRSSTERVKAYRARIKALKPPKPPPKSGAQRAREYRERQKLLRAFLNKNSTPITNVNLDENRPLKDINIIKNEESIIAPRLTVKELSAMQNHNREGVVSSTFMTFSTNSITDLKQTHSVRQKEQSAEKNGEKQSTTSKELLCSMRNQVQQHLEATLSTHSNESQSPTKDSEGGYKSNWFAYDSFSFLLNRQNPTGYNIVKTENLDDMNCSYDDSKDSESLEVKNDLSEEEEEGTLARQRLEDGDGIVTNSWSLAASNVEYEAATTTTTKCTRGTQPDCASFGRYVADKLASYSKTTKCAVQHAICEILFNADQGRFETYFQDYSTEDDGLDVAQDQE